MTVSHPPENIISRYCPSPDNALVSILGQGNINDTYLIRCGTKSFVLQKINDQVFPNPLILIKNLQLFSHHLLSLSPTSPQRWEDAVLIPTLDGSLSVNDDQGAVWRALSYIKNSVCHSHAETLLQAEQTGWALGHFHKRLDTLETSTMEMSLPGFHDLEKYLKQYEQISQKSLKSSPNDDLFCRNIINQQREDALLLAQTVATEKSAIKIIHGDPKIANVLFDLESDLAVSLIDLDTVGPGLLQHDIGDCLRSACNRSGEESRLDEVLFDLDFCEATLTGYFKAVGPLLTSSDRALIYDGLKAITYELGLRFFMDYLQGGLYFKCNTPEDTLKKALVQFTLLQDIIRKKKNIQEFSK